MTHELTNNPELIIEESTENFLTWINRPYIPYELKAQLTIANVLIIPREGFRERAEKVFPVGTEELFHYLKDNAEKGINVDLCIAENDYRELILHDALIIVGGFIVTSLVAPIVVDLISDYIRKRFGSKEEKTNIKVEMTVVEEDGRASRLLYEGSAKEFNKTVKPSLKSLADKKSDTPKELK